MIPQQLKENEIYIYESGALYLTLQFISAHFNHPSYEEDVYKFIITNNLIDSKDSDISTGIFLNQYNIRQHLHTYELDEYVNTITDL